MGQEWVYKATGTKAPHHLTRDLALLDGFLCKAAYVSTGRQPRAALVKSVHVGDVIHFYFAAPPSSHTIGSFEVCAAPLNSPRFSGPVAGTDLVKVTDTAFAKRLKAMGYDDDPKVMAVTGWVLRPANVKTPTYDPDYFPGQSVLRRYP